MIRKLNPLTFKVIVDRQGLTKAFVGGSVVKNPAASAAGAGGVDLIPGLGRSPGGGNGNPLQCSCLENPMHRGAWWATVHGVEESDMTEQLSTKVATPTSECTLEPPAASRSSTWSEAP